MAGRWVDFKGLKHVLLGISQKIQPQVDEKPGGGVKSFLFLPENWGNDPIWRMFFPMGWLHQLEKTHRP